MLARTRAKMTKLEELKAAFEAATPDEWENWPSANGDDDPKPFRIDVVGGHPEGDLINAWVDNDDDAVFIALAHNLMPHLLEAATELARFIDYLDTASGDGAYEHEIQRALAILEKLK